MYAVVTGASSGIGREIAFELARKHVDIILVARRLERLITLKSEIEEKYAVDVVCYPCDLTNENRCYQLFEDCKQYPVGVLINNAGFGKTGNFTDIPLDEEISMIQTNITALHILTKLFANHMSKGYILNVASIAAFCPVPIMATYGATKAYVLSLSRAINYELKLQKKEVSVSVLCPGPVDTEFNEVAGANFTLRSISAKDCAKVAVQGLIRRQEVIVPDNTTKLMRYLSKFAPTKLALPIEYQIQMKK